MAQNQVYMEIKASYCQHARESEKKAKHTFNIGDELLVLCRGCYGEIVVQVIEDLKTIKINARP